MKIPGYYEQDLKKQDQSSLTHDTPIELYESDGQFFINGGNNRMSLIMMKYLAELSKAQSEEEIQSINERYTFVAEVQPAPKDKDIIYMINMIKENYEGEAIIRRTAQNEEDFEYTVQIGEETILVGSKDELTQALKKSYKLENFEHLSDLQNGMIHLIQDRISYMHRQDQSRAKILDSVFPELEKLEPALIKLRRYGIESKLYDGIDLGRINLDELATKASELVEKEENLREEKRRQEEQERLEKEREEAILKEQDEKKKETRADIIQKGNNVSQNIEISYKEMEQEESALIEIAEKLGIKYSIVKISETDIPKKIAEVQSKIDELAAQIQNMDDLSNLVKIKESIDELDVATADRTSGIVCISNLQASFANLFEAKVQELIKKTKLSRLEQQRKNISSKKVTLFGKLFGEDKLKKAQIENISLNMRLIEVEPHKLTNCSLEESVATLYKYAQNELYGKPTQEMQDFLSVIESEPKLALNIGRQLGTDRAHDIIQKQIPGSNLPKTTAQKRISPRKQLADIKVKNEEIANQISQFTLQTKQAEFYDTLNGSNSVWQEYQSILDEVSIKTSEYVTEKSDMRHEQEKEEI